jgi:inosine-uridine nucleoside N-ribohydrolase
MQQQHFADGLPHGGLQQVKDMRVDIETYSALSAGQTVCDIWGQSNLPKNATVVLVRLSLCPFCNAVADSGTVSDLATDQQAWHDSAN